MIYLAADHRGLARKEEIKKYLDELGLSYYDSGNTFLDPDDDEIDFVQKASEKITETDRGIFFCGSGVMVDIVANRFPHLRSCLALSPDQVAAGRSDDNVNVLSLACDFVTLEDTKTLVSTFLNTPFSGEARFLRRLRKLAEIKNVKSSPEHE